MDDFSKTVLGRTGLPVCRLGVACSYGAPTEAFEEAFDHGVNYFWWGSRRTAAMHRAIRHLLGRGKRDELVIVIQSYSRSAALMERFYQRALKQLGIDSADILLLGWHNSMPSRRILDRALQMKDKGLFRFLGLSGHNRSLFPQLAATPDFDLFHIRYNAAHRGAEQDIFPRLNPRSRPGLVSYTATRWGDLLKRKRMPPDRQPLTAADCYRFVLSNPAVDVCMTGPKTAEQMKEALAAMSLGPLTEEEMTRVRQIGDHVHATSRRLSFR
jgi:aryl-alcohol dehydrogenase-like predicted oxidoreductase